MPDIFIVTVIKIRFTLELVFLIKFQLRECENNFLLHNAYSMQHEMKCTISYFIIDNRETGFLFYAKEIGQTQRRCSRIWGEYRRNNNVKAEWYDLDKTSQRFGVLLFFLFSRVINDTRNWYTYETPLQENLHHIFKIISIIRSC